MGASGSYGSSETTIDGSTATSSTTESLTQSTTLENGLSVGPSSTNPPPAGDLYTTIADAPFWGDTFVLLVNPVFAVWDYLNLDGSTFSATQLIASDTNANNIPTVRDLWQGAYGSTFPGSYPNTTGPGLSIYEGSTAVATLTPSQCAAILMLREMHS